MKYTLWELDVHYQDMPVIRHFVKIMPQLLTLCKTFKQFEPFDKSAHTFKGEQKWITISTEASMYIHLRWLI